MEYSTLEERVRALEILVKTLAKIVVKDAIPARKENPNAY